MRDAQPKRWTAPRADEIKMDAEIGSYQADDRDPADPKGPWFGARKSDSSRAPETPA